MYEPEHMDEAVRDEIINQGRALSILAGGDKKLVMELINVFGAEFRKTITDFKILFKKTPTPDQLIWIAGVHFNKDPKIIVQDIKNGLS